MLFYKEGSQEEENMNRKIALPLLVAAALVSIILASRTPQLIV